jgi:DNA-binding transcriptional ArsR family regulator
MTDGSNAYELIQFLAAHPEQEFTPEEISEETGVPRGSVGTTLARLEERELVRYEEPNWVIGDDDRLGAYEAMVLGLDVAEDRFSDVDWGNWRSHAVNPRTRDTTNEDTDR